MQTKHENRQHFLKDQRARKHLHMKRQLQIKDFSFLQTKERYKNQQNKWQSGMNPQNENKKVQCFLIHLRK